jgi:hypothetical protein
MKVKKGNVQEVDRSRVQQQIKKDVTQEEGKTWRKLRRRSCEKAEVVGELCCQMTRIKWKYFRKKNGIYHLLVLSTCSIAGPFCILTLHQMCTFIFVFLTLHVHIFYVFIVCVIIPCNLFLYSLLPYSLAVHISLCDSSILLGLILMPVLGSCYFRHQVLFR